MIKLHYGGYDNFFEEKDILEPGKHYNKMCEINSDINEHLPTLKKYAEMSETVTEIGVRFACSTWAFLEGKPKKVTSYDINYDFFKPSEKYINIYAKNHNIEFNFILGDSLKIEIEKTDLLFIDTLHTYNQLYNELKIHSSKVGKWIILHDTTTFGYRDESIYDHASDIVKNIKADKQGLINAVNDFLSENNDFYIKEVFTNNNGLTILERKYA